MGSATAGMVLLLGKVSVHLSTASEVDGEGIIYEGSLYFYNCQLVCVLDRSVNQH